jgi:pyridoxamine 5'-phosphate oxidase
MDLSLIQTADQAPNNPYELFNTWLSEAEQHERQDPNAVALATADTNGQPSVRMLLLKGHDETGFKFFTNFNSRKSKQLIANPKAAMCFHWKTINKQINIEGNIETVSEEEANDYFSSRHRSSCIGAWASHQSETLETRSDLEERIKSFENKFKSEKLIPRPEHWSGYKLIPNRIEFWEQQDYRLHVRVLYSKNKDIWTKSLLNP